MKKTREQSPRKRKERKRNRQVSEEVSQTDEEHKAAHSKSSANLRVNTENNHPQAHSGKTEEKQRCFSHTEPFLKGATVSMLTDFYTEMMAAWGRWKDILKVQK